MRTIDEIKVEISSVKTTIESVENQINEKTKELETLRRSAKRLIERHLNLLEEIYQLTIKDL